MLVPSTVKQVSLHNDWRHSAAYPPLGFFPFFDAELGNGDSFGLYWPIGRETFEPIVVEAWHDGWRVQPSFSSLPVFLKALSASDEEYVEMPSLADDPSSPRACYEAAKLKIAGQDPDAAISLLETAISILPEYTDALSLLHAQYVRAGRADEAMTIAVRAIISPPSFGQRPNKVLRWLKSQSASSAWTDDPIWRAKDQLNLIYGGTKENSDYPILLAAIDNYIANAKLIAASTLMQTYAELISSETVSFQERYGFNGSNFIARQIEISSLLPGGTRDPSLLRVDEQI